MTNYYDTLGLPDYENSQEAIKQAYKRGTQRLSEAATGNSNVAAQLIRLNEAFLVLSDVDLKQHYDYCLRYNLPSTYLEQAIEARRKRAKAFIESKLSTPPPSQEKAPDEHTSQGAYRRWSRVGGIAAVCHPYRNLLRHRGRHRGTRFAPRRAIIGLGRGAWQLCSRWRLESL